VAAQIAYIINNLTVGGAEKLLLSTVKRLNKEKYDITVCPMFKENALLNDFQRTGVKVRCLNMYNKRDIRGLFKLYQFFKSHKIDIVHTHLLEADTFGRFAAIWAKVPIIITTTHSVDSWKLNNRRFRTKFRLFLNRIADKHSNAIITVSDYIKNYLIEHEKTDPKKIHVIKNGIEIQKNKKPSIDKHKQETIVLGCVGRLFEEKGFGYLLRAFKKAQNQHPNLKLLIAGDGPLRAELEKLAYELGVSSDTEFMGVLDDIPTFLNKLDIFVLSSIQEGIPLGLLEAMAAGKPIVATKVGGIPEVVDNGSDGILVAAANVAELNEAIVSLIQDERKRKEMGRNARRKVVDFFNLDKAVRQLEDLYEKLLENQSIPSTIQSEYI